MSPVYQQYAPGLGEALQQAFENYAVAKSRRQALGIQAQQASDAHQSAQDSHQEHEITNAVNYNLVPAQQALFDLPKPEAPAPSNASAMTPADLARVFPGVPGESDAQLPADGGRPMPVNRHAMGRAILDAMKPQNTAQPAPQTPAVDPGAGFQANLAQSFMQNAPISRVMLPSGATIDPMAGFRRQAVLEQIKTGIATDADIRKAAETGVIDKNVADAALARRNAAKPILGEPGYASAMGDVAAAEATGRLPAETQKMLAEKRAELSNATSIEQLRASVQTALQHNQQMFDAGKLDKEQKFTADQTATRMAFESGQQATRQAGEFVNQSSLANQNHRSSFFGRITAADPQTVAPSTSLAPVNPRSSGSAVGGDTAQGDPRSQAIDAMLRAGMTPEQIKAALKGTP